MQKFLKVVTNPFFVFGVYALVAVFIALQAYNAKEINNFIIFQHSVFHFFGHQNPYLLYPAKYHDLFLYNPSFCVFFIPFAYLPLPAGVVLWVVFTALVYVWAIWSLPVSNNVKAFVAYLVLPDVVTSLQYIQTNTLLAGFILFSFAMLERERFWKASAFPPLGFFIKGYGGVSGVFFLLKKPRLLTFVYLGLWGVALGALPLVFYSFADFATLYQQWFTSLRDDYKVNTGLSVMGLVRTLVYPEASITGIQLAGVVCFLVSLLVLLFTGGYERVKYGYLGYVLIWVVIFNQASESATVVIASTGGFMWFIGTKRTRFDIALFVLFILMTVWASSDIFGNAYRQFVIRNYLKVLPCLLIWLKVQADILALLWTRKTTV